MSSDLKQKPHQPPKLANHLRAAPIFMFALLFIILTAAIITLTNPLNSVALANEQAKADSTKITEPTEPKETTEPKDTDLSQSACPARPQSANLARAMLALAATQNCEDLPYTKQDVETYIESLKCSASAKVAIERLSTPFAAQFEALFKGPQVVAMCAQAKNFKALK